MKQILFLFASLVLLTVQGWAITVDSLGIQTLIHTGQSSGLELAGSDQLIDGTKPNTSGFDVINSTTSYDSWSNLPSTKTFNTKVGKSASYTITFYESSYANSYGFTATKYNAQLDDATGMYTLSEQTCDEEGYFNSQSDYYYRWKKVFTVVYNPTATGSHEAKLIIKKNDGLLFSSKKTIKLIGTAINPSISVSPSYLTFSDATVGKTYTKTFMITGSDLSTPMIVNWSNNQSGMFSIENTSVTNNSNQTTMIVTVAYRPTAPGTHAGTITVSGGGATSKNVNVTGTCNVPTVTVNTSSISFGNVILGNTATKTIKVTGTNLTGNLTLSPNNSNFTVTPTTITPAQAAVGQAVTVKYIPSEVGNHSGVLKISGGGSSGASCQVNLTGTCVANQTISANPSTWDFGTVNLGNEVTKTFTITGTNLNSRISMTNQMETTGGEFTVTPTDLPATGGTVTVRYKPLDPGSASAVFVFSSGEATTRITVSGKCVVPSTITVNPSSLAFGNVVKGNTSSKTFTVTGSNLTGSLTVSSSNSSFKVSPTTITAAQAAAGKTVTVTYQPTAEGSHSGTITISGGGATSKTVNVTGKCVVPTITVNPTSLAFGNVVKNNTSSKTFTVTGTYLTGNLTVSSSNSNITVSPTTITAEQATAGKTVTVTCKPTAVGSFSGTITISGGGASPKTVSVTGNCVVPSITVNPTSLAFGNVVKGNTSSKTFTVTGTNLTGSLTVSSSNSNFKVSPTTITAAQAAAGKTVTVTYQPTAAGSHSGTITISGGGATSKTVSVTGKCVVPTISVSKTSLIFASKSSQTFKVTGTNLTGNLALIVKGGNGVFSASPTSITASQAANGVTVTVYCNPATNLQRASATIVISGGGASSKSVSLGYDSSNPEPMAGLILPDGEDEDEGGNEEFANGGSLEFSGNSITAVNELSMDVRIYPEGKNIIIESPVEQSAIISDVAGRARRVNLQAGRNEVPVNASGIYIVGIREKTAKLMIK